jgi:acetyltransferase-like isoleucine patch superfamily enzyme
MSKAGIKAMLNKSIVGRAIWRSLLFIYFKIYWRFRLFLSSIKYYLYNSFITRFPSYTVRTFYLRYILRIKIGKGTAIHTGCFFAGKKISIGNNTVIARNSYLDGRVGQIVIGNNVSIAPELYVLSLSHDKNDPEFKLIPGPVTIEDYAWIGARVMILPGIIVKEGGVLGAGSVVTKDVDEYTVVGGNPAKVIGMRERGLNYTLKYFPFFNTDIG